VNTLSRFGELTRELRLRNSFTIADQSKHLKISCAEISEIEIGTKKATKQYISAFIAWTQGSFFDHQELLKASLQPIRDGIPNDQTNQRFYRKMNKLSSQQILNLGIKLQENTNAGRLLREATQER
jgi:hypothetical protein